MFTIVALILVAALAAFTFGTSYGKTAEKTVVAKVLAESKNATTDVKAVINKILSSLDSEYARLYDEAVAEYDKLEAGIKKAL